MLGDPRTAAKANPPSSLTRLSAICSHLGNLQLQYQHLMGKRNLLYLWLVRCVVFEDEVRFPLGQIQDSLGEDAIAP